MQMQIHLGAGLPSFELIPENDYEQFYLSQFEGSHIGACLFSNNDTTNLTIASQPSAVSEPTTRVKANGTRAEEKRDTPKTSTVRG